MSKARSTTAVLGLVLAVALLAALARPAPAAQRVAHADGVRATLTWQASELGGAYSRQIRLGIRRRGAVELRADPVVGGKWWIVPLFGRSGAPVHVVDLAGDGEPEVLVDVFSGGASCCFELRIYAWSGRSYVRTPLIDFGETGYRLERFADGVQLVSASPTWLIVPTAHSDSGYPIQVWRYTPAGLRNATRDHPELLEADARRWRRFWLRYGSIGALAAQVVDLQRLGRTAEAEAAIDEAAASDALGGLSPRRFRSAVQKLMRHVDAPRPPYYPGRP